MAYNIGGGGGKAPGFTTNPQFALAKPGEITDLSDPGQVSLLDEMLRELYDSHRLLYGVLLEGGVIGSTGEAAASGGDVVGPDGVTADRLAAFDSTTGKLIKDSGYTAASLIAAAGGPIQTSLLDITELQLEALNGTPLMHIAAGGANDIHVPLLWIVQGNVTTAYSSNPNFRIRYAPGGATTTPDIFTPASIGFTSTGRKAMFADSTTFVSNTLADYKGTAVAIDLSAAPGTPGTGVAVARSIIYYVTLTAAY